VGQRLDYQANFKCLGKGRKTKHTLHVQNDYALPKV
jgi:hypothetical protein